MTTLLTSTIVTRKALEILHNKLNFIGSINRQYDASFANEGAKIGSTLKIRLPNQYTVRTGQTASMQSTDETSETLTIATQKGVDVNFTSADLTLSLDDFTERILEPAMAVTAANVESDAFNMYKDVYNFTYQTDFVTDPSSMATWLAAKTILNKNLVPKDGALNVCCNSAAGGATVAALSTLFHEGKSIASQYVDGVMGHAMGFDFFENEMIPSHTNGAATSFAAGQVNGATQNGAT
ncbi:MAG: P22 phage major capsid protein family protein, partial [Smithellaceae bacterium]